MTTRTFEVTVATSGPNGETRVVTTMDAANALHVLQAAALRLATSDEPEEIEIGIRLAGQVPDGPGIKDVRRQ